MERLFYRRDFLGRPVPDKRKAILWTMLAVSVLLLPFMASTQFVSHDRQGSQDVLSRLDSPPEVTPPPAVPSPSLTSPPVASEPSAATQAASGNPSPTLQGTPVGPPAFSAPPSPYALSPTPTTASPTLPVGPPPVLPAIGSTAAMTPTGELAGLAGPGSGAGLTVYALQVPAIFRQDLTPALASMPRAAVIVHEDQLEQGGAILPAEASASSTPDPRSLPASAPWVVPGPGLPARSDPRLVPGPGSAAPTSTTSPAKPATSSPSLAVFTTSAESGASPQRPAPILLASASNRPGQTSPVSTPDALGAPSPSGAAPFEVFRAAVPAEPALPASGPSLPTRSDPSQTLAVGSDIPGSPGSPAELKGNSSSVVVFSASVQGSATSESPQPIPLAGGALNRAGDARPASSPAPSGPPASGSLGSFELFNADVQATTGTAAPGRILVVNTGSPGAHTVGATASGGSSPSRPDRRLPSLVLYQGAGAADGAILTSNVGSTAAANTATASAAPRPTRAQSSYRTGEQLVAHLETRLIVPMLTGQTQDKGVPVVAKSADGTVWMGQATSGDTQYVQVRFTQAVRPDGTALPIHAIALSPDGAVGLAPKVQETTPALAQDLLRSAISGVSSYVEAMAQSSTIVRSPDGFLAMQQQVPDVKWMIAGEVAKLFKLPQDSRAVVRIGEVPKGTELHILVMDPSSS